MQAQLPSSAQVDEALRRVYARHQLEPRQPGLLDRFAEWRQRLWQRIGEWFGSFGDLRSENPLVYWLIIGLLVAAALAIVLVLIRGAMSRLDDRPAPEARPAGPVNARVRTAGEWEDEARRAAAAGRYRDAAVALYQALLLRLEAAGIVRYDPAKTPGDYRREARRDPRAAGALTAFLRGFEPAVFGGRPLDGDGYERLRAAAAEAGGG
jgi:Domain of unknown function (DUF4129)